VGGSISKNIEQLDRQGMRIIEDHDGESFSKYLSKTENTICGRHPISLFLEILKLDRESNESQDI